MDSPTSLQDLLAFDFLAERLNALKQTIAGQPNQTVVWVGAGHSSHLAQFPTWRTFLEDCLHESDNDAERAIIRSIIEAGRLQLAAEYLHILIGEKLFAKIGATFSCAKADCEPIIARFGVTKLITTNYDSLLEDSMPWYTAVTPRDKIDALINPEFKIVKLHGSARNPTDCVLSVSSYARTYTRDFDWYLINTFLTQTVVFIGASMEPSEPFFRYLSAIRQNGLQHPPHYALVSVTSSSSAKSLAKRLKEYGILLIPFIPEESFANFGAILEYLAPKQWSGSSLNSRLQFIFELIKSSRFVEATALLYQMCCGVIEGRSNRRFFGDAVYKLINLINFANNPDILKRLEMAKLDLGDLCIGAIDLLDETSKSFAALIEELKKLQSLGRRDYGIYIHRFEQRLNRPRRS